MMYLISSRIIQLLVAEKCAHTHVTHQIIENADESAKILGLDSLDKILRLIPITNTTSIGGQESTCLGTMSHSPQTKVQLLESVLLIVPCICPKLTC